MSGPVAKQPTQTWAGVVVRNLAALLPRRSDWTLSSPGRDLLAGLMVGLVALPLALGFGVASGLGAGAGIVTAVVAGAVAAVFGGSRVQVSGPTGAMTVVLVPIVATYGAEGVLVVGLMAGLMLLALSVARAGRFIRYLPVPVVEGFTAGIAVIIALQQVPSALGVDVRAESVLTLVVRAVRAWAADVELTALGITLAVVVAVLVLARWRPRLPGTLGAVVVATVATQLLGWNAATIGELPSGIPVPAWPDVPWGGLGALVLPAVAVAALAALESLLSATVADGMSVGQRHDPDRELFGQGLANLAAPLFGGIPATAAIARTGQRAVRRDVAPGRPHPRDRAAARDPAGLDLGLADPARGAGRRADSHGDPDGEGLEHPVTDAVHARRRGRAGAHRGRHRRLRPRDRGAARPVGGRTPGPAPDRPSIAARAAARRRV